MITLTLSGDPERIEDSTLLFQVALDAPAVSDSTIFIALTPSDVATAPATVTIAAGQTSASFNVVTSDVNADTALLVTASFGSSSDSVQTTIIDGESHIDQPPIAQDDHYIVVENTSRQVNAAHGVIVGTTPAHADSDPENDPLAASLVAGPQHGLLTFHADGSFAYTPSPGFEGQDHFTYLVNDGQLDSNIATVTLTVGAEPPPSPLGPADDGAVLLEGGMLALRLTLDAPAGPGGVSVNISIDPSSIGSAPATVLVPEGQTSVAFDVTASLVDHDSAMSITASYQGQSVTWSAQVLDASDLSFRSGDTGDNLLTGGGGRDLIHGDLGNDQIVGRGGNDMLFGDAGNDTLSGGAGDDKLVGGDGNDVLDGGTGNDEMHGGAGNDTYRIDSTGDEIFEFANGGADTVQTTVANYDSAVPDPAGGMLAFHGYVLGHDVENLTLKGAAALDGAGNDADNRITGNAAANILVGNDGNDALVGNAGNDHLMGNNGNDKLQGGDGNDVLDGGAGKDVLTGGAGSDTFVLSLRDSAGADRIVDFGAGDTIAVRSADYGLTHGPLDASLLAIGTADAGHAQFVYRASGTGGQLLWDANGDAHGGAVVIATFDHGAALRAGVDGNFIVL